MTAFEPSVGTAGDDAIPANADAGRPAADPRSSVAMALARLDSVHRLPLHEQPDVYQAVHAELQHALAAIDDT